MLADAVRLFNPDPSRSVGLDAETGSIEAGKAADCVLVEAGAR
ncbi:MAG: amidohydrolase family protein [Desulfobulbaceae bacterium]|nr:amidohydrolase family protein [Desulfobulbaceae bacterium]